MDLVRVLAEQPVAHLAGGFEPHRWRYVAYPDPVGDVGGEQDELGSGGVVGVLERPHDRLTGGRSEVELGVGREAGDRIAVRG